MSEKNRPQEVRKNRVSIRLNLKEKFFLDRQAEASGLTVTEYVRRKITGKRIYKRAQKRMTQTFITIRLQLVRLSGLFKHLYNCNPLYKEQTAEGLRITIAANGDVERILRRIGEDVTPINLQEREQTE